METKIKNIDKKVPKVCDLVTATVLDTIIKEVDNKISDLSGLVKKIDYDAKILEVKRKYFTTSDYNKFRSDILDANIENKKNSQTNPIFLIS